MRQVNQQPSANDLKAGLQPLLRDYGFTINQLIRIIGSDLVLTADLPAAGASQDGKILIEDAGAGDVNLVIYAKGQRYRFDGGAPF